MEQAIGCGLARCVPMHARKLTRRLGRWTPSLQSAPYLRNLAETGTEIVHTRICNVMMIIGSGLGSNIILSFFSALSGDDTLRGSSLV